MKCPHYQYLAFHHNRGIAVSVYRSLSSFLLLFAVACLFHLVLINNTKRARGFRDIFIAIIRIICGRFIRGLNLKFDKPISDSVC